MHTSVFTVMTALSLIATNALARPNDNPPWCPSLQAFERYDSGRSHVFSQAEFLGSYNGLNMVLEVPSMPGDYPYLSENDASARP